MTHNQIILLLRGFAVAHKQINSMGFGDYNDDEGNTLNLNYSPDDKNSPVYPMLWADTGNAVVGLNSNANSQSSNTYTVWILDKREADDRNTDEVLSDTQQILYDLLAFLQNPQFSDANLFYVDKTVTLIPFRRADLRDVVTGWSMNIVFRIPYLADRCAIPLNTSDGGDFAFLQTAFNLAFS